MLCWGRRSKLLRLKAAFTRIQKPEAASDVMWKPERIQSDADLSLRLLKKLDEEKGVEANPLIGPASATEAAKPSAAAETQAAKAEPAAAVAEAPKAEEEAAGQQDVEAKENGIKKEDSDKCRCLPAYSDLFCNAAWRPACVD